MKIKLLRKVRKNYRIVKNGFNVYWIEKIYYNIYYGIINLINYFPWL